MRKPTYEEVIQFLIHLTGVEASIAFWKWVFK